MRKEKFVLPIFLAFVLICAVSLILAQNNNPVPTLYSENPGDNNTTDNGVVCTMDAKMCPDGSSVGRIAPDCRFAPCPGENRTEEAAAYLIAQQQCSSVGNINKEGTYNPNSKTWWFNLNPFNESKGCHPACVVSLSDNTAEVNWRCTGAIVENNTSKGRDEHMVGAGAPRLGSEKEDNEENETRCEPWNCTKWSTCVNGTETRQCTKIADCNYTEDNEEESQLLGNSCGTVTPGSENQCCINKGYTGWDAANSTCIGETKQNKESTTTPKLTKNCHEKEKVRSYNYSFECPENCTCTGSTLKCELSGGRVMTVYAGNSGNVIIQIEGVNTSTNVTLYKEDGKIYGNFSGNRTKEIHLPDEVKKSVQYEINTILYNESINLTDDGYYHIEGHKKSRLFWLVPVREHTSVMVDAETGETVKIRNPWWGFLAKDVKVENGNSTDEGNNSTNETNSTPGA